MAKGNTIEKDMSLLRETMRKTLDEQGLAEKEAVYSYWLDTVAGVGRGTILRLRYFVGTPGRIYAATEEERAQWVENGWLSAAQETAWKEAKQRQNIQDLQQELEHKQIRCVPYGSNSYPKRLREIADPPANLYVCGELPTEKSPSVAIVGARLCSDYGRYMARQFGIQLAKNGVQVISGMAMGVDGISQQAALEAGGKSFGVLGCGADICYPEQNHKLYETLIQRGGVLSEYVPGTEPQPRLFPPRNRIISGCADLVLVVEARKKSGTLITVDAALEQGREVYVLPGRVTDTLAQGCNELMRQGAGIAVSTETIAEAAWEVWQNKWQEQAGAGVAERTEQGEDDSFREYKMKLVLSDREWNVYQQLSEQGKTPEELYRILCETDTSWSIAGVSATLVQLCVHKYACTENGRFYRENVQNNG